ncbi:MAG: transglutaminase domain-containing protein [Lachnospiraceae bacterium]|nr:transglutaminase domain-containing protein [Lachnospiraceae bacterium]
MNTDAISKICKDGNINLNIEVNIRLKIKDNIFQPGTLRVHLPAPINAEWLKEGQLVDADPFFRMMSVEDYPQRSAYFNEIMSENKPFSITYAFTSEHALVTPEENAVNAVEQKTFSDEEIKKFESLELCGCESYTALAPDKVSIKDVARSGGIKFSEKHYQFIEQNRILPVTKNASGYEVNKKRDHIGSLALKIFNTVTDSYVPTPSETLNMAFVSICRICGIPARWQGGYELKGEDLSPQTNADAHDWAMIHLLPYDWIYVDCENARKYGVKHVPGNELTYRDYFFGNIDPCLVPTASEPSANLYPAKDYERADKIFNVYGEVELIPDKNTRDGHYEGRGLKPDEFDTEISITV